VKPSEPPIAAGFEAAPISVKATDPLPTTVCEGGVTEAKPAKPEGAVIVTVPANPWL